MAFTLHWSNPTVELWRGQGSEKILGTQKKKSKSDVKQKYPRKTALDYEEKIGCLTPVLSLTSDILYPNAEAAVRRDDGSSEPVAVGCKGHQIDEEFPLKSRLPTCVPLVQYPTAVSEKDSWEEQDICALPVLNWEKYVCTFKQSSVLSKVRRGGKSSELKEGRGDGLTAEESEVEDVPVTAEVPRGRKSEAKLVDKGSRKSQGESMPSENDGASDDSEDEKEDGHSMLKSKRIESLVTLRKYTNVPEVRVEGTWNYNYHHTGACDWTHDPSSRSSRILLVGKGRYLRAVKLGLSKPTSAVSFAVEEVFDEEKSLGGNKFGSGDSFDNVVFQITANRKESIALARRGVTIDLYSTLESPRHLTSIPVYGFISKVYHKADRLEPSRRFISSDLNLNSPYEVASLDENYSIRLHDIVDESSSSEIKCPVPESSQLIVSKSPQFPLNRAAGLLYTNYRNALYYYYDSSVFFFDTRENLKIMDESYPREFHALIDLKSDSSAKAISDQRYFSADANNRLHEYISCVQRSQRPNYYYIGTTHRVLLMDWRVPKNPVIKMSHGMKSAASYISTDCNKNIEIVVAGSQRSPQVFSAVLDYGHVSCEDRPGCKALNPILASYPRHLSNPGDFMNTSEEDGVQFVWEEEQQRIRQHCNAWCTGLTMGSLPVSQEYDNNKIPRGSFIVSTNNFGDVFYQEWIRGSNASHRFTSRNDTKWKSFLTQWQDSMKSKTITESFKPSTNPKLPEDCSLLIEPNFSALENVYDVRQKQFDPLEVDPAQYREATESTKSLEETCCELKNYKGPKIDQFVDVWEKDWRSKTSVGILHPVGTPFESYAASTLDPPESEGYHNSGQQNEENTASPDIPSATDFLSVEIKQEVEEGDDRYRYDESEVQVLCTEARTDGGTEAIDVDETQQEPNSQDLISRLNRYAFPQTSSVGMFGFEDSQRQSDNSVWDSFGQSVPSQGSFFNEEVPDRFGNAEPADSWNKTIFTPPQAQLRREKPSQSSSYPVVKKRAGF